MNTPLAETLRPTKFEDLLLDSSLLGTDGFLTKLLSKGSETSFFPSLIFWGPPGCGKTSLARLISTTLEREWYEFSAVNTSIREIESVINRPPNSLSLFSKQTPIVFIDEIHRFNKSQQDALLPHVEKGSITLLGATTENPSFSIINALLSRCRVISFTSLDAKQLSSILQKALDHLKRTISDEDQTLLISLSDGDARSLLNILQIASHISQVTVISKRDVLDATQKKTIQFDKSGENFYTSISALHKSIRGSDPNASLYWLARMVEGGADPLYIARRLIRIASEDIGNGNPSALQIALNSFQTCTVLGLPECSLALAQATEYLATSPKSNKIYTAFNKARADARMHGSIPVPHHLRNASTKFLEDQGYGKNYVYAHSATGTKDPKITYFPEEIGDQNYF